MRWSKKEVIYQIFVDRWQGADPDKAKKPVFAGGNLESICSSLTYFKDLGVTALWLTPIFQTNAYHGYHTTDFMKIDPHFGTLADFKKLVKQAHAKKIKIMLDLVPNHISSAHPFFKEALHKKKRLFRDWFYFTGEEEYKTFFGYSELPKLNLDNQATRTYMVNVAKYWLSLGVDGYRLDHAVGPSISFWKEFVSEVKKQYPHCILIGEVWLGSLKYKDQMTTNAKHKFCRWLFRAKNDAYMKDYQGILDGCLDFTFNKLLREHILEDTDKNEFSKKLHEHYKKFSSDFLLPVFLDNHDMDRFRFECKNKEQYKKAIDYMYAQDQPVIIYYGDETGMTQKKSMHDYKSHGDLQARQVIDYKNGDEELFTYFQEKNKKRNN